MDGGLRLPSAAPYGAGTHTRSENPGYTHAPNPLGSP